MTRHFWIVTGFAILLAGLWHGLTMIGNPPKKNIILLSVESLRADMIAPETTPNLLRAASDAYISPDHRGTSGWTGAGMVSILTGQTPYDHGVHSGQTSFNQSAPAPLKQLSAQGYDIVGLQPFMRISAFRNLGLDIHTDTDIRDWLVQRLGNSDAFFLWYHYLDTHLPYMQRESAFRFNWRSALTADQAQDPARFEAVATFPNVPASGFIFTLADKKVVRQMQQASVREFDAWFGQFYDFLDNTGQLHNTILVVTSDHGEEHGERGAVGHASTTKRGHLYEEIVKTPLMVWAPESTDIGYLSGRSWTDHTHILRSVFSMLDIVPHASWQEPADSIWRGLTSRAGFAEEDLGSPDRYLHAARQDNWKLHAEQSAAGVWQTKLYDLGPDPGETLDISGQYPEIVRALLDPVRDFQPVNPATSGTDIAGAGRPEWLSPPQNSVFTWDDLENKCLHLQWSDQQVSAYRMEFVAGSGLLASSGQLTVQAPEFKYCDLEQTYWYTFVRPYGSVKIRVAPQGTDQWSSWLTLKAG